MSLVVHVSNIFIIFDAYVRRVLDFDTARVIGTPFVHSRLDNSTIPCLPQRS